MRRTLILCTVGLIFFQFVNGQKDNFYERVLRFENCRDCFFIVLNIESEPYTGRVLIENDDLLKFITDSQATDRAAYTEFVKEILTGARQLFVKDAVRVGDNLNVTNFSSGKFRVVTTSEEVDRIAEMGCTQFLRYFFLNVELSQLKKGDLSDCRAFIDSQDRALTLTRESAAFRGTQDAIIAKLFDWEIPIKLDHYSGWLTIPKADGRVKQGKP